ncbi:MAG: aquaporin [Alphaproteobacteria bacterium]|nr:aquaporin [Alphaproteobacteria bacterium]MBU0805411.1 aquaporin [Alphaproteobacteria bacterium]MBU0873357.1 aquaporin [Alphaproteobacteria bacterium]MBU1401415.1 aquaporin [Alphaproteobacteria bacterium]MBU1592168.1 aquaporin [Alphaproteobacteria bacterium]
MNAIRDRGNQSPAGGSTLLRQDACFFEADARTALTRRAGVEGIGTLMLMLAIVGSGQMSARLAGAPSGLGLLIAALATAGALIGLIVSFGAASGGHFNPLITLLQWLRGERGTACTVAYVAAQLAGGVIGAMLGSHMTVQIEFHAGSVLPIHVVIASEMLASAGLMLVVFGCSRSGRTETGPFAVGAWLAAAIIAMPSMSYANPAVTIAALFASGPAALQGSTAAWFVLAELAGALFALLLVNLVYPTWEPSEPGEAHSGNAGNNRGAKT